MKKTLVIGLIMIISVSMLFAETIEEKLQKFGQENAEKFIQPAVNCFSGNLNSGLYNTAKVLKPFRFQLSFNVMTTFVPDEDKSFIVTNPFIGDTFNPYQENEIETATIFGTDGGSFTGVTEVNGVPVSIDPLKMPDGLDLAGLPLVMPQFALGLPFGNEVQLRYFPKTEVDKEIGDVGFLGIGVKHSIDQYFPGIIPIDVAIQGFYQKLEVGELIEIKSLAANAQLSKKFLIFTFYGGLGWEKTDFLAEYKFTKETFNPSNPAVPMVTEIPVKLELESDNSMKATVGMRLSLLFLKLYGDYSFAKYNTANVGIGLGF